MKTLFACICCIAAFSSVAVMAQDESQPTPAAQENVSAEQPQEAAESTPPEQQAVDKAKEIAGQATEKAVEIADKVDQDERAKEAAAGILQPIYRAAEVMGSQKFPAFYWLAFALMAAGTVSYALQLALGKLLVLFRGSINLKEILSDLVGLLISVVGLVLTTQAATENSGFTQSPALVLSASAVGIIFGFMLFRWGTAQEVSAVAGQRTKK